MEKGATPHPPMESPLLKGGPKGRRLVFYNSLVIWWSPEEGCLRLIPREHIALSISFRKHLCLQAREFRGIIMLVFWKMEVINHNMAGKIVVDNLLNSSGRPVSPPFFWKYHFDQVESRIWKTPWGREGRWPMQRHTQRGTGRGWCSLLLGLILNYSCSNGTLGSGRTWREFWKGTRAMTWMAGRSS